jgi:hypothetical protein
LIHQKHRQKKARPAAPGFLFGDYFLLPQCSCGRRNVKTLRNANAAIGASTWLSCELNPTNENGRFWVRENNPKASAFCIGS